MYKSKLGYEDGEPYAQVWNVFTQQWQTARVVDDLSDSVWSSFGIRERAIVRAHLDQTGDLETFPGEVEWID